MMITPTAELYPVHDEAGGECACGNGMPALHPVWFHQLTGTGEEVVQCMLLCMACYQQALTEDAGISAHPLAIERSRRRNWRNTRK